MGEAMGTYRAMYVRALLNPVGNELVSKLRLCVDDDPWNYALTLMPQLATRISSIAANPQRGWVLGGKGTGYPVPWPDDLIQEAPEEHLQRAIQSEMWNFISAAKVDNVDALQAQSDFIGYLLLGIADEFLVEMFDERGVGTRHSHYIAACSSQHRFKVHVPGQTLADIFDREALQREVDEGLIEPADLVFAEHGATPPRHGS